jgi:hypothetical protein
MHPIIPPRPEVAAALLSAGMELRHRATGQHHRIDWAERIETTVDSGWLGPGSPHPFIHRRTGDGLAISINGAIYRDPCGRSLPGIADLLADYELPPFPFSPRFNCGGQTLMFMEQQAGFRFYSKQRDVILSVASRTGALIAVDTGGGKTLIGISLLRLLRPRCSLVLAPQGLLDQWGQQFARFWPGQEVKRLTAADIRESRIPNGIWISYHHEFLLNDGGLAARLAPEAIDCIIIDEAHLLMNSETIMASTLFRLRPQLRYALTATPVPNRLDDPYPLCRWLLPGHGFRPPRTEELRLHSDGRREIPPPTTPLSPSLYAADLAPVVVAVRKSDMRPDLPSCRVEIVRHPMSPELRASYQHISERWTMQRGDPGTIARVRQSLQRGLCARGDGPKDAAIRQRISRLNERGEKVVVACARTRQTTALSAGLASPSWRIDSTVNAKLHAEHAAAFKQAAAPANLFIGIKCAYGYSFSDVAHLVIGSPEWGLGTVLQTLGRVWRLDSQRPVLCEVHVYADSIEEEIVETLALKESAATAVLYGSQPLLECVNRRN